MIYRRGFRPKRGNIFYSPSLHVGYAIDRAVQQAIKNVFGDPKDD